MPPHPYQATWDDHLRSGDPLAFPGYVPPGEESVLTGPTQHYAVIEGRFDVLGGSMGAAHGERVVRAFRRARDERLPMVVLTSSGGARMHEGMVSLIQMARTAAASREHSGAGLLQIAVLGNPTTGGVYASYASLCDIRIAAPGATIGFAGPRVVEMTTGEKLPRGAQTAEFAYEAGLVDALVPETEWAPWLETALATGPTSGPISGPGSGFPAVPVTDSVTKTAGKRDGAGRAWDQVVAARAVERWSGDAWARALCQQWTPLHGTGEAFVCGLATIADTRVGVVAMNRRQPRPADYRMAQRTIVLAGRLGLPLLTFVDTPGADPRPDSERDGIAGEIARTLAAMATFPNPSVSVCVGEGGSGGALALAFADRLLMQEHSIFSVIAPEGAAAILERDASKAAEIADQLCLTATELHDLGIVDEVLPEPGDLGSAVAFALRTAPPGDRNRRFDEATARWLR
ncbi:MAG: carboxyl transferase domain-containing protein [Acidimicrobiia bacterium]